MNEFQMAFMYWLDDNRTKLALQPSFYDYQCQSLIYSLVGVTKQILIVVGLGSVQVEVHRTRYQRHSAWETWSIVKRPHAPAANPNQQAGETAATTAPLKEKTATLFAALETWINETLAPAHWLVFADTSLLGVYATLENSPEFSCDAYGNEEDEDVFEAVKIRPVRRVLTILEQRKYENVAQLFAE
ncbi:MAG: hypothetical protein KF823_12225 [Xanthomonadales bacterium]|nr:hypothetical protein [Xanthomonadales bacterium]